MDAAMEPSMGKEGLAWHAELEPSACRKSKRSCFCKFQSLMDLIPKWHCLAFGLPKQPILIAGGHSHDWLCEASLISKKVKWICYGKQSYLKTWFIRTVWAVQ